MSRIGIYGGSFNPIHKGHLYVAETLKKMLSLDRVIFVPTGIAPHKDNGLMVSKFHRYQMVCLATEGRFEVSDIEIVTDSVCYASDTVLKFKQLYRGDDLFYIIGADSLADFMTWHEPLKLFKTVHLAVADRDDTDTERIAEEYRLKYGAQITVCHIKTFDASSTDIRRFYANDGNSHGLVPEMVEQYIIKNGLYTEGK